MVITTTLRSVQVKVSQRFSTITGDWLGDSLSDMTTGTHVAPQAKKHARNISPTGMFSVERHWTSHLLLFTATPLQVHDWRSHHAIVDKAQSGSSTVISPHSPDFPCSPSDFIPSSEGSFPGDSRICQVCAIETFRWDTRTKSKNPPLSSN